MLYRHLTPLVAALASIASASQANDQTVTLQFENCESDCYNTTMSQTLGQTASYTEQPTSRVHITNITNANVQDVTCTINRNHNTWTRQLSYGNSVTLSVTGLYSIFDITCSGSSNSTSSSASSHKQDGVDQVNKNDDSTDPPEVTIIVEDCHKFSCSNSSLSQPLGEEDSYYSLLASNFYLTDVTQVELDSVSCDVYRTIHGTPLGSFTSDSPALLSDTRAYRYFTIHCSSVDAD